MSKEQNPDRPLVGGVVKKSTTDKFGHRTIEEFEVFDISVEFYPPNYQHITDDKKEDEDK